MFHTGDFGARTPALEQSFTGIDDPESLRRDMPVLQEPSSDVNTVNSATDNQPIEVHRHALPMYPFVRDPSAQICPERRVAALNMRRVVTFRALESHKITEIPQGDPVQEKVS